MAKLTLTNVTSGHATTNQINANNDLVEAALENTVSRDGTTPNAMNAELDMNSNKIINTTDPDNAQDVATKNYVDTTVTAADSMTKSGGHWDATGLKIEDVAEPDSADDVATKNYVDTTISGSGNVPAPSDPADDGKVLKASGGLFSWVDFTIAMISDAAAFMLTFLADTTAGDARTTLGAAGLVDANVFTESQTWKKGTDVVSATDLLVNIAGNMFDVSGATNIQTIATKGIGTLIVLHFDSASLTISHHSTNLILPGAADITTQAGDIGVFYEYASADWRCVSYTRSDGTSLDTIKQGIHTIGVPVSMMIKQTDSAPADYTEQLSTSGLMIESLDFSGVTSHGAQFYIPMPKSSDETATISFEPFWTAKAGAGTVSWNLNALARGDNEALDTVFGTSVESLDTFQTADAVHKGPASSGMTPSGTWAEGDILVFAIGRDVTADTKAEVAKLLSLRLTFTINAADDT